MKQQPSSWRPKSHGFIQRHNSPQICLPSNLWIGTSFLLCNFAILNSSVKKEKGEKSASMKIQTTVGRGKEGGKGGKKRGQFTGHV